MLAFRQAVAFYYRPTPTPSLAHVNQPSQAPDFRFVSLLRESYWLLREVIDARLEPLGLSQARWRPLLCLHLNGGPMTQVELARMLSVESPTVVRLLDRLGECGWIVRRACPQDRRAYHVELTPRARRLCVQVDRIVSEIRIQGLTGISARDLAVAISVLERARDGYAQMARQELPGSARKRGRKPPVTRRTAANGKARAIE